MQIKKTYIFIGIIALALIVVNALIFFGVFDGRTCIPVENYNVYVCGGEDPVADIKELILNSHKIDIVFESDAEPTQKGSYIAKGVISFAEQLDTHDLNFYGIGMQNNRPVECVGGNYTVEYCQNIKPTTDSALIYVKYPHGGSRSEIEIKGRTVYFKPAAAIHLQGLVNLVLPTLLYYS